MEKNTDQELQTLKADYILFKERLDKLEKLNEKIFKSLKKRPMIRIRKEIRNRILGDVINVPTTFFFCICTDWSLLFGVLVSLWSLADLGVTLWVSRKLEVNDLLFDDVRTVTEKIVRYRKFYKVTFIANMVFLTAMMVYIFLRLYALGNGVATVNPIIASCILSIVVGIMATQQYKKQIKICKELLDQFEEL